MKIVTFLLFLVAAALVFYGLNRVIRALAYPLEERYLHGRIVLALFLVLLAATNVYTVSNLFLLVDKIINSPQLANFFNTFLPNRAYSLLYMLLALLGLNLCVCLITIVTVLAVKLVFIRKRQFFDVDECGPVTRFLHLPWMVAKLVYDHEGEKAALNSRGFTLGIWARAMKWACAILWVLETLILGGSILWGSESWNEVLLSAVKSWYLLPMAAFLLLEQVQFFLEGYFDEEAGTFGSAEVASQTSNDLDQLCRVYQNSFASSGMLLYSAFDLDADWEKKGLSSNDLGNQQLLDCSQPDVLSVISNQLRQCGVEQRESYQNAVVALLNGRSVNVCDDCQGDFLIYLIAYLNFYISQGRTALVLCRDQNQAGQMYRAVYGAMRRLNGLHSVWNICNMQDAEVNGQMSILVCTWEELLEEHILSKRRDFSEDLFCTVIADGMELFSRDSIRIERLFNELHPADNSRMQYVIFSAEDNNALRTAVEQVIKEEVLPFNDYRMRPHTNIMVWREESCFKPQCLLGVGNALSPHMGTALPLALVAVRYDLPQLFLIPDSGRGYLTYDDVLTMSSKEVFAFLGRNVNLKSVIRSCREEAMQPRDLSVLVLYDTDYNFFNALWRWMKYGGTRGTLLHVVSPAYLLREYFAANAGKLLLKNNEFDAFIPYHLGMRISHMAVLLVNLCDRGMTEEELFEKCSQFGWHYDHVEALLADCLRVVLREQELHSVYECFHFEEEKRFDKERNGFVTQTRIVLTDETIRSRLQGRIAYAELLSKGDQRLSLPVLGGNVLNYYLREQIAAFDGSLYRVRSINGGSIFGEQVFPQDVPDYFQISSFSVKDYQQLDSCVDSGLLDLNICTAAVDRSIYGYWSSSRGNEFAGSGSLQVNDLRDVDGNCQSVHMEHVNLLELNFRRSAIGDSAQEAVWLCAYMLRELAKTLFPLTYQNLYVAAGDTGDSLVIDRVLARGKESDLEDMIQSIIPKVKGAPESREDFITLYVIEFSCVEYGMIQMLYSNYKQVLMMMREYLTWYLGEDSPGRYLHFGAETVPGCFNPEGLLRLCRKVLPEAELPQEAAVTEDASVAHCCTFCGKPSLFLNCLEDGRFMCADCKDHQLTQRDEIKSLFVETVALMERGYDIALRKNIHVRFQSAAAIAKAAGNVDGGRILGFYQPASHQLWLESRGPKVAMQSTLAHELTHAWQFDNLDLTRLLRKFPRKKRPLIRLLLLEGHAVFVEIDTMRRNHEIAYAERLHRQTMLRQDEYGVGYRMLCDYIKEREAEGSHMTPFTAMQQLVQDIIDGKVTINNE